MNDQTPVASAITRTKAALSGVVDPEGYATHYKFAYGLTSSYVHSTIELNAGAPDGDLPVGPVGLEGLAPGTTYHYALVATNPAGTTTGSDQTFTTAAATPPMVHLFPWQLCRSLEVPDHVLYRQQFDGADAPPSRPPELPPWSASHGP